MREISSQVISDSYPLPLNESKKLIPQYRVNTPIPMIYKKLRKRNNKK
jgi:hypothetical protein